MSLPMAVLIAVLTIGLFVTILVLARDERPRWDDHEWWDHDD